MALGDFKTFSFVQDGLTLEATATDIGGGKTSITVKCLDGYADINALYWNDGNADGSQFDLGTKKDNSLNMNGTGEDWDGGVKLSSTGLGSDGLEKSTYLTTGESYTTEVAVDWAHLDTLGIRATSTSTPEGSIKAVDNCASLNLFTENFDGYDQMQKYFDPADSTHFVYGTVDLNDASGWTNAKYVELGADGYGNIDSTSGEAWLDTQNSPGSINISHEFTDTTAAVEGVTSVLSFDIGIQNLDYLGKHYETNPDASFEFRIDGKVVADFDWSDFQNTPNVMQHFDIDITDYAAAGDTHTLSLVDTSPSADYTGFSVDSIQINDWVLC